MYALKTKVRKPSVYIYGRKGKYASDGNVYALFQLISVVTLHRIPLLVREGEKIAISSLKSVAIVFF